MKFWDHNKSDSIKPNKWLNMDISNKKSEELLNETQSFSSSSTLCKNIVTETNSGTLFSEKLNPLKILTKKW